MKVKLSGDKIRYGTGIITSIDDTQTCQACLCQQNHDTHNMYGRVTIFTSNEIITSDSDVDNATFIFGYYKKNVKLRTLYGLYLSSDPNMSSVVSVSFVAHANGVRRDVEKALKSYDNIEIDSKTNYVAVIGHPHGGVEKLSFGKIVPSENQDDIKINAPSCPGLGGAPVIIFNDPVEIRLLLQGNKSTTGALCSQTKIQINP